MTRKRRRNDTFLLIFSKVIILRGTDRNDLLSFDIEKQKAKMLFNSDAIIHNQRQCIWRLAS